MCETYRKMLTGRVTRSETGMSLLSEFVNRESGESVVRASVVSSVHVRVDDQLGTFEVPCSNEVAHGLVGRRVTITVEVLPEGRGNE